MKLPPNFCRITLIEILLAVIGWSLALLLAGCNALGGIPDSTYKALADAGGGTVYVESVVLGKGCVTIGSADKGVIRNGRLNVTGANNCGSVTVEESRVQSPVGPMGPQPNVTSETTSTNTTTTKTIQKAP